MNKTPDLEPSPRLTCLGLLTSSATLVVSLVYTVLTITGLVFRGLCDNASGDNVHGSGYFMNTLFRTYIVYKDCVHSLYHEERGITDPDTVFVFGILILVVSLLTLGASIALLTVILLENVDTKKYIPAAAYTLLGIYVASLILDMVCAIIFGTDFRHLLYEMSGSSAGFVGHYETDVMRLGAMFLLVMSAKGFVYHVVIITLFIWLLIDVVQYQMTLRKNDHSIHKLGTLNAFSDHQPRRQDEPWQSQSDMAYLGLSPRGQQNSGYLQDDDFRRSPPPRSPASRDMREPSMSDYSNRYLDRSESWQARPAPPPEPWQARQPPAESWQARQAQSGSRPFSYLGEPNRVSNNSGGMNQRPPQVPAPDYSPPTQRRLKSALKPAYM